MIHARSDYDAIQPWRDEHGNSIGNGIDCAPLASQIIEWVNAHDLTGLPAESGRG